MLGNRDPLKKDHGCRAPPLPTWANIFQIPRTLAPSQPPPRTLAQPAKLLIPKIIWPIFGPHTLHLPLPFPYPFPNPWRTDGGFVDNLALYRADPSTWFDLPTTTPKISYTSSLNPDVSIKPYSYAVSRQHAIPSLTPWAYICRFSGRSALLIPTR